MKKICYLLCMICAMGVFNACSDDDDDAASLIPVTEIVVPARVQAGSELIIAGNGFATDCKIFLKNEAQSVELTVSERLSTSVSCTVPATLASGEYTVVLKQSGEWPLRKITVLEKGAGNTDIPVTALMLPTDPVDVGKEITIQGIGFAEKCEIDLKVGKELQKMEITVSNNGVKFTLPETLADGTYPVILKQDGGQWTLGEITVKGKAVVQKTQIDKITETWTTKKGTEHVKVNSYTYNVEKISSIETIKDEEKQTLVEFDWSAEGKLVVNVYPYDPDAQNYDKEYYDTYEYVLGADGNVESTESSGTWSYTQGYLSSLPDYLDYLYENAEHITGITSYDGNYSFDYTAQQANKSVLDLTGEVLHYTNVEGDEQYYARIAGVCGKAPDMLPSSITLLGDEQYPDESAGSMIYETYPEDGYIWKIKYDDEHTLEITYK